MPITTTGVSPLPLSLSEATVSRPDRELIGVLIRQARKIDWNAFLRRADRAISIAGAAVLILAGLYFAPLLISILFR